MNTYLLRFIREMKNGVYTGSPHRVKKYVSKFNGKYFGTIYSITDARHQIRMYVRTNRQDEKYPAIYIDREDCYDKLANCPIQLPAPKNDREYEKLFVYVRSMLLDDRWYDISNSYIMDEWIQDYTA